MAEALSKIECIPAPDSRRPTRMPSLPAWLATQIGALRENLQIDPATSSFREVLTLPRALMLTKQHRMAIEVHIEQLRSLSAQTPEAGAEFGKATLVIVTKVLLVLPSQRTTEAASEAKAEAYMMALEDVPYWAVEAAARKWFRNDCGVDERGRPFDYQWAPSPGPLRRIAQLEAGRLLERIVVLERLLHAVEFVDSAAELTAGRAAWRGLWKTVGAHRNVKELTFHAAVKLGSERAARDEGVGVGADDRTKPDLPDPQEHHSKDVAA
jgi:hypothetical protein